MFRWQSLFILALSMIASLPCFAQEGSFEKLLDYSRPNEHHQLLADLAGYWSFKGHSYLGDPSPDSNKLVMEFNGSIQRKPFGHGRFFIVEITGGKLQIPIQNNKMEEASFQSIETEGYDNVKGKYVLTVINNHIGSDIEYTEGDYDALTKTITYLGEASLLPGTKEKVLERFVIVDKDQYRMEYYNEKGGKIRELVCTRIK